MFNPKTLFALNKKDQDAIVFTDANGGIIRLTSADFESEDTFRRWKSWYMKRLNEEENENHTYADNTLSLDGLPEALTATPSPEIVIERRVERKKRIDYSAETVIRIKGQLTEKQFRRLWMYCVRGMTEQEIAVREAVGQQRISKSINAAVKKIKKFFASGQ